MQDEKNAKSKKSCQKQRGVMEVSTYIEARETEFSFIHHRTNFAKNRPQKDSPEYVPLYIPTVPKQITGFVWHAGFEIDESFNDEDNSKFKMTIYLDASDIELDDAGFNRLVELAKSSIEASLMPY